MIKSDFALFLQWLEGDCPCPCVCMSAVPGAAQTQAFLSVVRTPRAHRSQGTLFFPRKRSRRSAAAQPGSPAESSLAPQRAVPAPSWLLQAAPAAARRAWTQGRLQGNGREQRFSPCGPGGQGATKSLYWEYLMGKKTKLE